MFCSRSSLLSIYTNASDPSKAKPKCFPLRRFFLEAKQVGQNVDKGQQANATIVYSQIHPHSGGKQYPATKSNNARSEGRKYTHHRHTASDFRIRHDCIILKLIRGNTIGIPFL